MFLCQHYKRGGEGRRKMRARRRKGRGKRETRNRRRKRKRRKRRKRGRRKKRRRGHRGLSPLVQYHPVSVLLTHPRGILGFVNNS